MKPTHYIELTDDQYATLLVSVQNELNALQEDMDALVTLRDKHGFTHIEHTLKRETQRLADLTDLAAACGIIERKVTE